MSYPILRVVFMGTPAFAVPSLDALLRRGHDVVGVFTQPDRRAGRGRRLRPSPVKEFAEQHNLPVFQPASLRNSPEACDQLAALEADAIVVAAYGLFLPKVVLETPEYGCLNIHPSLLPKFRGPSPVISAILEGEETSGVTIMLLDEGMDTGPLLAQESVVIGNDETSDKLTNRLFDLGADLLVQTLDEWVSGNITPSSQDDHEATITRLLKREDGLIDWSESAIEIERRIRAFTPWPGTFTSWNGSTLKVLRGKVIPEDCQAEPGTVCIDQGDRVLVSTGAGALKLLEVQLEGRPRSRSADFARGQRDFIGSVLGG
ncbi:MAG: methionyl-tRNA formyltransferase [Dehalococcoidia bacterium]|nr:methionyl-tRNA formyltransferase [Dehalococcoidia bacterium]